MTMVITERNRKYESSSFTDIYEQLPRSLKIPIQSDNEQQVALQYKPSSLYSASKFLRAS